MSRINGEKARAALQRRRRTAQRAKDRVAQGGTTTKSTGKPMAARAAKRASKA